MVSSSLSQGINNRIDAAWSGGLGDAMSNALPYYPVYRSDTLFNADGTIQRLARRLLPLPRRMGRNQKSLWPCGRARLGSPQKTAPSTT